MNLPRTIRPGTGPARGGRLAAILPPERLLTRPVELAAYESDGLTAFRARPLAVAVPETRDEVVAVVRACRELGLPVHRQRGALRRGPRGHAPAPAVARVPAHRAGRLPHARAGRGGRRRRIAELSRAAGIRVANVFHAGDGNLHPLILFDGREPGALERAEPLAGRILRMCVAMGGSITGEHGVGVEKREFLADMFGPDEIDCMRRLKAAFDPLGIANPGKMFPGSEAPALSHVGLHPLERAGVISRE